MTVGRWYVQLAAIWHRCLALCIYMISSSSVFLSFFKLLFDMVLIN